MLRRALNIPLIVLLVFASILVPRPAEAMTAEEYFTKSDSFVSDYRWANGTSWGSGQRPKISDYESYGCFAYGVDFAKYMYNVRTYTSGSVYYSASEIRTGDVIRIDWGSSQHTVVVLERNGNTLRTAEGNINGRVRVNDAGYTISGNGVIASWNQYASFRHGYHFDTGGATTREAAVPSNPAYRNGSVTTVPTQVTYLMIPACASGKGVSRVNAATGNGTRFNIWDMAENNESWQFSFVALNDGTYAIAAGDTGKYLHVNAGEKKNGTPIVLWDGFGNDNSSWWVERNDDGSYSFRNRGTDRYLDVTAASNLSGTLIEQWEGNGSSAQKFWLDEPSLPKDDDSAWHRVSGGQRYETMALVIEKGFDQSDWAVVASGEDFPDALVASTLAGSKDCPIILTQSYDLSNDASSQLRRLEVQHVLVVGGPAAVSDYAVSQMSDMGIECTRIAGYDRQSTSLLAFDDVTDITQSDTVVVASGQQFPDALSIAPWCYANAAPILLTGSDRCLSDEQVQAVQDAEQVERIVIVGGPGAVSETDVRSQLGDTYEYVILAGADRYETSARISVWEMDEGMGITNLVVASGEAFPDALAGSALCGVSNSVLVLVPSSGSTMKAVDTAVRNGGVGTIRYACVLGGKSAVGDAVLKYCRALGGWSGAADDPDTAGDNNPVAGDNNPTTGDDSPVDPTPSDGYVDM